MSISRRDALLGATAAAVVTGAITAPLAIKAAGAKTALAGDPVIDLAQQLRAASDGWFAAIDAYEDAAGRAGFNICYDDGLVTVETPDGRATWGASEIRAAVDPGRYSHRLTPEQRDAALAEIKRRKAEAHTVRQELGIESLYQEREHWKARFWELQARLLDTPATTVDGVLGKLRGFYNDGEIAEIRAGGDPTDPLEADYAASVYRDLERLAGGVPS